MSWTKEKDKLVGFNGTVYEIIPEPFWYVVPARIDYSAEERLPRPLDFAMVMHNASLAEGLLSSPTVMAHGLPKKTLKGGAAAEAEYLLEKIREEKFPNLPSRLQCYYLNASREAAEHRMNDSLRGKKRLVECYMVRHQGSTIHLADSEIYERLEGRPDDAQLALTYWNTFLPVNENESFRLEILLDSSLYFPEWQSFPRIDQQTLIRWQKERGEITKP